MLETLLCFGTQALKVPRVKPLFLSGKKKGFKEKRSRKRKKDIGHPFLFPEAFSFREKKKAQVEGVAADGHTVMDFYA